MGKYHRHRTSVEATAIRNRMTELVALEDKKSPLTDQQLSEQLDLEFYSVRYYRDSLGIPAAHKRMEKNYD